MSTTIKLKSSILQHQKRICKSRFEIHCFALCSQAGLIALGSQKGIVELIREAKMTMCWRIDISLVSKPVGATPSKLQCLEFCPDGEALIAATNDGLYHMIHVPSGTVVITRKAGDGAITQARWSSSVISGMERQNSADSYELSLEEMAGISVEKLARIPNVEGTEEKKRSEWKDEYIVSLYENHIKHTILSLITDSLTIWVVASGVMTLTVLDIEDLLKRNKLPVFVCSIYDAMYSPELNGLVISCFSQGNQPKCGEHGKFGLPTLPNDAKAASQTHVVLFNLKIVESQMLWTVVGRFIKLTNSFMQLERIFEAVKKHWEGGAQSNTGCKKGLSILDTTNRDVLVHLGPCLVTTILSGECGPRATNQFCSGDSDQRFSQLREFAEKTFTEVISMIRTDLGMVSRLISFQTSQICADLDNFVQKFQEVDPEQYLLPACNEDVNVYPYGVKSNESRLGEKVNPNDNARLAIEQELLSAANGLALKIEQMSYVSYVIYAFVRDPELKQFYDLALEDVDKLLEGIDEHCTTPTNMEPDHKWPYSKSKVSPMDLSEMKSGEALSKLVALSQKYDQYPSRDGEMPNGTFSKHKHDCVSSFFCPKLDENCIELLEKTWPWDENYPRINDLESFKKAGLKKCIDNISSVLSKVERVLENFTDPKLVWMCEIASDMKHLGFETFRMEIVSEDRIHLVGVHSTYLHSLLITPSDEQDPIKKIAVWDVKDTVAELSEEKSNEGNEQNVKPTDFRRENKELGKLTSFISGFPIGRDTVATVCLAKFETSSGVEQRLIFKEKLLDDACGIDMDDESFEGCTSGQLQVRGWRACAISSKARQLTVFRLNEPPSPVQINQRHSGVFMERKFFDKSSTF
ncbi:hypothetical protein WR25_00563 [Diploscapter pachys]|uniref:Anaphase-promoting complex subunit 4-like WD40 domain-containing protein n=1 Tax=Diploscapter pachys TaxID=2018661 RepID=A0A2A2JL40_9BILA|nr:hypothetical protein WR25_00563 [Diploscapter pachys]